MLDKKIIQENFSKYAEHYDNYANIQRQAAQDLIGALPTSGINNILEIGCGTGIFTELLLKKFPRAKLCAIDFSPAMLSVAQNKLNQKPAAQKRTKFVLADAEYLKLEEKFDLICSNACFQWLAEFEETLKMYKKILNPGGGVVFSIFGPETFRELRAALEAWQGQKIELSAQHFITKQKLQSQLKKLFKKVTFKEKIYKETNPSLTELLRKIKYTGTRGQGIPRHIFLGPQALKDIAALYLEKFKKIITTYQIFYCKAEK
ncbi:MAG: malonyl-ACP O-methyltransferase BioC [Candidatus Margulisiibacteriota bacterium]